MTQLPPTTRVDAPPSGHSVGKYRILGELGRGAMGVVYRASDPALGRDVALKCPVAADASPADRHQVLKEARAASRVSHPHVVPVYEVFEHDGCPWLAMQFVDGPTLRDVLAAEGRLAVEDVIQVGEQLAEALAAAHSRHVFHRDLKPGNIMLPSRNDARLMDFGVARAAEASPSSSTLTVSALQHGIAGTLGYASPEQLLDRPILPASDLFSLGAVLYEAITWRRAFDGETAGEIFDATLYRMPPPLTDLTPDAPVELQRIVSKALAKRADERYQSGAELAADLRTLRRQLEAQGHDQRAPAPPRTFGWRGVAAAALVVAAAAGWVAYQLRGAARIELGPPRQLTAGPGWEAEPAIAPDGTLIAYTSTAMGGPDIWLMDIRGGPAVRLTDDPANDGTPTWFPDGSAVAFTSDRSGRPSIWKVSRLGGPASIVVEDGEDPAISPDGTTLAFARRDATGTYRIHVAPVGRPGAARMVTNEFTGLWNHRQPAWSPDGRNIAYKAARDLWMVAAEGGRARPLTLADAEDEHPAWSPEGKFVYFSSNREGAWALWRTPLSGGAAVRLTGGQGPERHPQVSHDGMRMVYSTSLDDTNLVIRDIATGAEQQIGGDRFEFDPVFSPDGRSVAFVSDRWMGRYDLWLQPFGTGTPLAEPRHLTEQAGSVAQPAFSPDGRWIAYHRAFAGKRQVWVVSAEGGEPNQITVAGTTNVQPDWSPDGRQIVFVSDADGSSQLWTVPIKEGRPAGTPARLTDIRNRPGSPGAPTWSHEGIAFIGPDSDVWIIKGDGRSEARRLTTAAGVIQLAWNRAVGTLWAVGTWGGVTTQSRVIDMRTAEIKVPATRPLALDDSDPTFDLSWDGSRIAFVRRTQRGHLWVQPVHVSAF